MRNWLLTAILAAGMALSGCGSPSDPSQRAAGVAPAAKGETAAPKRYAAADLPAVAVPLTNLDGDVELAPPQGWRVLSRDPKYLARFVKSQGDNSLPRITVSPSMPAPEGIKDVSEENVAEFAEKMQQRSAAVPGRKMLEPERPIIVGDYVWSRHVRQLGLRGGGRAAVQSLATARGGRLYLIELTVESPGETTDEIAAAILKERDAAYAVAASWKFIGESAESEPTKDSPPESAPPPEKQPD